MSRCGWPNGRIQPGASGPGLILPGGADYSEFYRLEEAAGRLAEASRPAGSQFSDTANFITAAKDNLEAFVCLSAQSGHCLAL